MDEATKEQMNKDLERWVKETHTDAVKTPKAKHIDPREPRGMCSICGDHEAKFICLKCNNQVCPSCYFKIIGICKNCIPKDTAKKWEGTQPDWEKVLGVQWVD